MVCIYCGSETAVTNSRYKKRALSVWRRRACSHCKAVVTTFESYDLSTALLVKKRSGALEEFQRDKILISIARSIEHRKNTSQAASELTNSVLSQLLIKKPVSSIISTNDISHMTSIVLKRYDAVSSIKYLSYQAPTNQARDVRSMLKE